MADEETVRKNDKPEATSDSSGLDMIGDDKPDVPVDQEEVAPEVPTTFATKGLGWSGREHRKG